MKISIKKKIGFAMIFIGIVMILFCWSNVSALKIIEAYNDSIDTAYANTIQVISEENQDQITTEKETMSNLLTHSKTRISGTLVFDYVLLGLSVVIIVFTLLLFNKSIVRAAVSANSQLEDISSKLNNNKGDLTQRIQIKSNDEIGELATGINTFMGILEALIEKLDDTSRILSTSTEETSQAAEKNK